MLIHDNEGPVFRVPVAQTTVGVFLQCGPPWTTPMLGLRHPGLKLPASVFRVVQFDGPRLCPEQQAHPEMSLYWSEMWHLRPVAFTVTNPYHILRVQPTRCNVSQFIYFCKTLCMFQTGFPNIIRSSELHIQRQVFVRPLLLPAASLATLAAGSSNDLTLYVQFWGPDDGRKSRLKHVERLAEINKLWNYESHRCTVHFVKSLQLLTNKCTYITFT